MPIWRPVESFDLRRIDEIHVHHSAGTDRSFLQDWKAIWDEHVLVNGWFDIGYHAVVEMDGGIPMAHFGRPEHVIPASVFRHNSHAMAICIVGNFSLEPPSKRLLVCAARRVVAPWCVQYDVQINKVLGHREIPDTNTECPGLLFDMDHFRDLVSGFIPLADAERDPETYR